MSAGQEQFEKTYSMKKTKLACHLAKLEDANYVGDPMESNKCILILTKGDFANALVVSYCLLSMPISI